MIWYAVTNVPTRVTTPSGSKPLRRVYKHEAEEIDTLRALKHTYPDAKIYRCSTRSEARDVVADPSKGSSVPVELFADDVSTVAVGS